MSIPVRWELDGAVCEAYEVKERRDSRVHGHHHFLLTLITRGRGVQTLNGKEIPFAENEVFILSPADFHKNTVRDDKGFDYFGVKFHYSFVHSVLSEFSDVEFPIHLRPSRRCVEKLRAIFPMLIEESSQNNESRGREELLRAALTQMLVLILRELPSTRKKEPNEFYSRSLGFLYSNFRSPVTVAEAAAYSGYSENYFNTMFREHFGKPFLAYVRDLRLEYSKNLLISSEMSETEIALESGFSSLAHFSRSFSKKYGICAKDFRAEKCLKANNHLHIKPKRRENE